MSLADRFRARLTRGRQLAVEARPPLLALPAPPRRRRQEPAEYPLCRRCGLRHSPRPHQAGGAGLAAAYGRTILPDPSRPVPLNRQADDEVLVLFRRHRPWQQP